MPRRVLSVVLANLGVYGVALACFQVIHSSATVAAILLLLGVLLAGIYRGRTEAFTASLTASLCLDYFFIPPIGKITVGDVQGWIVLVVFLAVSLVATNLSALLRRQRDELIARQKESDKLHALSRAILLSAGGEDLRRMLVNKTIELFRFEETALLESGSGEFYRSHSGGRISIDTLRKVAVNGSVEHEAVNPGETTFMPVTLGHKTFGSFAFRGPGLQDTAMQALGNTLAVGLAQAQAQEAASRAEAIKKSEELKSLMIDALAHDLKTPLTAIEAAVSLLHQPANAAISAAQRQELLEVIQQEALRLRRLMNEAIHLARIEARRLKLEFETLDIAALIDTAIRSVEDRAGSHLLNVEVPSDIAPIVADRELMVQVLKQLLDNAIKYSTPRSTITVAACEENDLVSISVRDQSQGLTDLEQRRVFDKFYRGRRDTSAVQGTGMGLAIAREIAEAHGGSVSVESKHGQGSRFTVTLRSARAQPLPETRTA